VFTLLVLWTDQGFTTAKPTQRIGDVISMAGVKGDADLTRLNLASHVADEMMVMYLLRRSSRM